jgi:hypothetical protein
MLRQTSSKPRPYNKMHPRRLQPHHFHNAKVLKEWRGIRAAAEYLSLLGVSLEAALYILS